MAKFCLILIELELFLTYCINEKEIILYICRMN